MTWQEHAACRGIDPRLFGPVTITETIVQREARVARAAAICADCPVRADCSADGIIGHESGVWGGKLLEDGQPAKTHPVAAPNPSRVAS